MSDVIDDAAYDEKIDELDHLLNDPDVPLEPVRVWELLAQIAVHDVPRLRAE